MCPISFVSKNLPIIYRYEYQVGLIMTHGRDLDEKQSGMLSYKIISLFERMWTILPIEDNYICVFWSIWIFQDQVKIAFHEGLNSVHISTTCFIFHIHVSKNAVGVQSVNNLLALSAQFYFLRNGKVFKNPSWTDDTLLWLQTIRQKTSA